MNENRKFRQMDLEACLHSQTDFEPELYQLLFKIKFFFSEGPFSFSLELIREINRYLAESTIYLLRMDH